MSRSKKYYKSDKKNKSSKKIFIIIAVLAFLFLLLFYLTNPDKAYKFFGLKKDKGIITDGFVINNIEDGFPEIPYKNFKIYDHNYYSFAYSKKHVNSFWVSYILTRDMVRKNAIDRDNEEFTNDPLIKYNYAVHADYTNSGYDRGHLCPAGDMNFDPVAMSESFYMTNISPQKPGLNRDIWRELEESVRDWAYDYDSLYIVTGAIFADNPQKIGYNQVAVPAKFYKVIADISKEDGYKTIAFIFENKDYHINEDFMDYAISVDELEEKTGIDFFAKYINDDVEKIESNLNKYNW